jgi:hypothetical protein
MTEEMATVCPFCDYHHECVSAARSDVDIPEDGDVSMCFRCGRFCLFDREARGGLRKPTKREQREFDHDDGMQKIVAAWKTVKRQ